jgi:hypothetical protein
MKTKVQIPSISAMNNFQFEESGVLYHILKEICSSSPNDQNTRIYSGSGRMAEIREKYIKIRYIKRCQSRQTMPDIVELCVLMIHTLSQTYLIKFP